MKVLNQSERQNLTANISCLKRFRQLIAKPDFKLSPTKALWRRFYWRLRWKLLSHRPWVLSLGSLRIAITKSGAGALIYYQGVAEPETRDFLLRFLKTGIVFLDIGAHLGEFALYAATKAELLKGSQSLLCKESTDAPVIHFEYLPSNMVTIGYDPLW